MRGRGPAPVVTPEGTFGDPSQPDLEALAAYDPGTSPVLLRLLALTVVALATAWVAAQSVAQATSEGVATEAQARGLATLTEVDTLLAFHAEDLRAQATEGATTLELPGFPVPGLAIPTTEVVTSTNELDLEALRDRLLAASAARTYEDGSNALRPDATASGGDRAIDLAIDTLTREWHDRARLAALVLGGAAVVLGALLVLLGHGLGRFVALGVALTAAGILAALGALALRAATSALGPGPEDPVLAEYASVLSDLAALPLRNGLVLAALGLVIALPATVLGRRA